MAVHNCRYCKADCGFGGEDRQRDCKGYVPVTNADKIRAMTDEELATFLETFGCCHYCSEHHRLGGARFYSDEKCDGHCQDHLLEWLQRPVEGSE